VRSSSNGWRKLCPMARRGQLVGVWNSSTLPSAVAPRIRRGRPVAVVSRDRSSMLSALKDVGIVPSSSMPIWPHATAEGHAVALRI